MQRFGKTNGLLAAALLAVAAIHAGMAWALTETVTSSLLTREAALTREFLQGIVKGEDGGTALFATPAPSQALAQFAKIIEALPGVARANVYSADRFIRHSTESTLIGLKFATNEELEDSFNGGMSAKLEEITVDPKPEHLGLNKFEGKQFIEAYMPLNDAGGRTFAVVEIYSETDGLFAEVKHVKSIILICELLAGAIMLAVLYGLFRRPR